MQLNFLKMRFLIQVLVVVLGIFYVVIAFWTTLELFCVLARGAVVDNGTAINHTGLIFIGIIGVPLVVWKGYTDWVQAQAAQDSQITERFTKAVEQLAAVHRQPVAQEDRGKIVQQDIEVPSIDIRIGGLYALERLSKDSEKDHIAVMETICGYVRTNADLDAPELSNTNLLYPFSTNTTNNDKSYRPRQDICVALLILGRRAPERIKYKQNKNNRFELNLSGTRLRQLDMENANFRRASFSSTDFTDAYLAGANLTLAWLYRAQFNRTVMRNCKLDGAVLTEANLRNAIELDQEKLNRAYGVREGKYKTLLPDTVPMPEDWFMPSSPNLPWREFWAEFDKKYEEYKKKLGLEIDT